MPIPMIAAAMMGEKGLSAIVETSKGLGAAGAAPMISYTYVPTIEIGKGKTKKEIPDPHFPTGIQVAIPGWAIGAGLIVGVPSAAVACIYILDVIKRYSQSKEKDPLVRLSRATTGWGAEFMDTLNKKASLF